MLFSMNAIELDLKELLKKDEKKGESSKSHSFSLNNLDMEQLFPFIMNFKLGSLRKMQRAMP